MNKVGRMAEIIGLSPVEDKIGYKTVLSEKFPEYRRLKIEYNINGRDIPAFLFLPRGEGKFPAVLINHQHHSQRNFGKSEVCGLVGDPLQAFAPLLAAEGFIVIAPDALCFEERRKNAHGTKENATEDERNHFLALCHGILTGETLAKIAIEDAIGAVSVLNGMDFVDKEKIGCMGHSYGGNTTYFAAAFDKRIKYALSSGSVISYAYRIDNMTGIEFSSIIPGFLKEFEIKDIISEIAPRDFMIVCADKDKYSMDAPKVYEAVRTETGGDNLHIKCFSGEHQLTSERFDFIIEWIKSHK